MTGWELFVCGPGNILFLSRYKYVREKTSTQAELLLDVHHKSLQPSAQTNMSGPYLQLVLVDEV